MYQCMIDGIGGFRSRFDEILLIQEILDEIPVKLGLQPASQSFLLPYYNGINPDDCGISAFSFLTGGHFTLHTFSFREAYFADILSYQYLNRDKLMALLNSAFPRTSLTMHFASRDENSLQDIEPDTNADFGPHILMEIDDYNGPESMDSIFHLLDALPSSIGLTPIMRPYVIKGEMSDRGQITSAITMIAESHISLHVFHDEKRAYFDLFSCSFFDRNPVLEKLKNLLIGEKYRAVLIPRGSKYHINNTKRTSELEKSRVWLKAVSSK